MVQCLAGDKGPVSISSLGQRCPHKDPWNHLGNSKQNKNTHNPDQHRSLCLPRTDSRASVQSLRALAFEIHGPRVFKVTKL